VARRQPEGPPPPPVVQRLRIRFAKRGRLRFASHRDFARAFERALRRAEVPMAYSAGFTPHPKISYLGAAPTGTSSEAEYLEIGLAREVDPAQVRDALNACLPEGFDIVEAVVAGTGGFAERIEGSHWRIELPDVPAGEAAAAVETFLAAERVPVQRLTKDGRREIDARSAVVRLAPVESDGRAILDLVVRHATPAVRPDDVLAALRAVGGLAPSVPPRAVRLAQGPLDTVTGEVGDPLTADR
jgi:radical SAM-linked protein